MILKMPFYGYRFDGIRYDCGSKGGLLAASLAVALSRGDLRNEVLNELSRVIPHNINSDLSKGA